MAIFDRILILPPLAALLASAGMLSCSGSPETMAGAPQRSTTPTVAVVPVTRHDLTRDLELAAEFRPNQEIELHAKVSGFLNAIHVDVGDRVSRGQPIAELEAPEMIQELAQAKAAVQRMQLEVERAKGELRRAEAAREIRQLSYQRLASVMKARPNLIAQQEIDTASAQVKEAEAQFAIAQAALASAQEQVRVLSANQARLETLEGYLRIRAPFSGMITQRYFDPGAIIQAGTSGSARPLVRLSQIDRLRLVLPVPESIASQVRVGSPVEVRVDSLQRVFQGRVSRFSGKLEFSTRTMETEVDLPNPDDSLLPGMYGYAMIRLDRRNDALAVPVQAIADPESKPTVLVVNANSQIEERRVVPGLETPNLVEILSGLKEGERVLIGRRSHLKPGMTVQAKLLEGHNVDHGSH